MWRLFDRCGESEVGSDGLVPLAKLRAGPHHGPGCETALPNELWMQTRRSRNPRTDQLPDSCAHPVASHHHLRTRSSLCNMTYAKFTQC